MNIYEEYKSKLRTPEEAVKVVKDGDWVDYSQTCSFPFLLDAALAARKEELKDVKVRNAISMRPVQVVEQDPEQNGLHLQRMALLRSGPQILRQGSGLLFPHALP